MGRLRQEFPVGIKRRHAERTACEEFEDRIHNTETHNKNVSEQGNTFSVNLMCGWPCIVIQCG